MIVGCVGIGVLLHDWLSRVNHVQIFETVLKNKKLADKHHFKLGVLQYLSKLLHHPGYPWVLLYLNIRTFRFQIKNCKR